MIVGTAGTGLNERERRPPRRRTRAAGGTAGNHTWHLPPEPGAATTAGPDPAS